MLVGVFGLLLSLLVWGALGEGSPHRSLVYPVVEYAPHAQQPGRQVAVLIPET